MPTAPYELLYEGAKEMLLVDEVDNKEFLTGLFHAMYDELPALKPKNKMLHLESPSLWRRKWKMVKMEVEQDVEKEKDHGQR